MADVLAADEDRGAFVAAVLEAVAELQVQKRLKYSIRMSWSTASLMTVRSFGLAHWRHLRRRRLPHHWRRSWSSNLWRRLVNNRSEKSKDLR